VSYQSLYRRYRSQSFSEVKGQSNVTDALRTAVSEGRYGHAYMFSGPRGTGKTSTARVLAKALNCENQKDGEPCNSCESCEAITNGKSFDLHELDAASNNKVDDVRDLISKVHLGSPGRIKVYILDEVHMLSSGAENALLKTLEEPPEHVIFVLATTEPHKVVSTIRSRTQHFKFGLLPSEDLDAHVRWVAQDAGFEITDEIVSHVISEGGGSARDTLSSLDLVMAGGGIPNSFNSGTEIVSAIADQNSEQAILAVQKGLESGSEPRTIGEQVLAILRNCFLSTMGAPLSHISELEKGQSQDLAKKVGAARLTNSLEVIGSALVEMRQAPDQRVPLEVAILKLTKKSLSSADGGDVVSGLIQRIEELEEKINVLSTSPAPVSQLKAESQSVTNLGTKLEESQTSGPAASARKVLESAKSKAPPSPRAVNGAPETAESKPQEKTQPVQDTGIEKPVGDLTVGNVSPIFDQCLEACSQKTRVRFKGGQIQSVSGNQIVFTVPNQIHADRCTDVKSDLVDSLSVKLGKDIILDIQVDNKAIIEKQNTVIQNKPKVDVDIDLTDIGPIDELEEANDIASDQIGRIKNIFPGSKLVENNGEKNDE